MPQKYNKNTTATVHSHDCQELLIFIFPYKNPLHFFSLVTRCVLQNLPTSLSSAAESCKIH